MPMRRFALTLAGRTLALVLGFGLFLGGAPGSGAQEASHGTAPFWDTLFWSFTTGFDFSRGDYGLNRDSTLYYVPVGVTVDRDRLRLRIVLPFLVSEGPTAVGAAGGPVPQSESNSGFGEITTSGSYVFDPVAKGFPFIELGGQVTAPTRSKNELGTGEWAFTPRIDFFEKVGPFSPFASAGRTFFTSLQSDSLDDRFFASVGGSLELTEGVDVGVSYDWLEATNGAFPDAHEIVPFLSVRASKAWTLSPYAVFGLSDASPDYGFGFGVRFAP